jgi:predicted nucleotidyltransferase
MTTKTLSDILAVLRTERPGLQESFAVSELGVFGSVARGEAEATSDIDILVEYSKTPTLFEFVRLQRYLSELLDSPVDLVMKSALKPSIGRQILLEVVSV